MAKINEGFLNKIDGFQYITARDCADFIFLTLIAFQIMKNEFNFISQTRDYAHSTMRWYDYKKWHFGSTDLYSLLYMIQTKSFQHLKHNSDNTILLKRVSFNQTHMTMHLRELSSGVNNPIREKIFFYDLENSLMIMDSNYKSMRKLSLNWKELSYDQKQLLVTRLLQAYRIRIPRMDMRILLESFAGAQALERDKARNIEKERVENERKNKQRRMWRAKQYRDIIGGYDG